MLVEGGRRVRRCSSLRHVIVIGGDGEGRAGHVGLAEAIGGSRSDALDFEPSTDRDTVCALFHTGGTTGRPKLVRLTHGNQIHAAFGFAQVFGYDERDVVINGFPFFHVGGTMTVGLSVLAAGGHIVVPSPYGLRLPAVIERYWDIVRHFRATVVGGVPTSIAALTNSWREGNDASSVRMAVTGGAVLPKAIGSRFEATTGIQLFETYGMTETAAAIAFNPGRGTPVAGSVGFRAPYSETRIVRIDPANPGPCGVNESGLVQVRGPQVFPGYLDPAHNEGTLDAEGWLTTGDVGYMTAGRAARPHRTGEGPDRSQRPQYRPCGDRGCRQPIRRRADQRCRRHARPVCRRGPGAVRRSRPGRAGRCRGAASCTSTDMSTNRRRAREASWSSTRFP